MSVTVNHPFQKRSPLRELASYFYQGRLSREDYLKHRANLLDHLCGLDVQLDPVVAMLIRASDNNAPPAAIDITEPQDRPASDVTPASTSRRTLSEEVDPSSVTRVMGARPPREALADTQPTSPRKKSLPLRIILLGVSGIVVLLAVSAWLFYQ